MSEESDLTKEQHYTQDDIPPGEEVAVGIYNRVQQGCFKPFGPTIYLGKIEPSILEIIKQNCYDVRGSKEHDYRRSLAGNMSEEYNLFHYLKTDDNPVTQEIFKHVSKFICGVENQPSRLYNHYIKKLEMESMWVNFMKAFEWNPEHTHSAHVSYVLYVNVPNDMKEEEKHPTQQSNSNTAGSITLAYGEDNTYNITIKNIVPETGDILVFPNWLRHYVYPFTTDVERISVAGNVYTDKTFMGASTHKDGGNVLEEENPHKEFSKKAYEHLQNHKHIKKH